MRNLASSILLVAITLVGSGAALRLHQRNCQRARNLYAATSAHPLPEPARGGHDEHACAVCLTLHTPIDVGGNAPPLLVPGPCVAPAACPPFNSASTLAVESIDCRGPPVH